MAMRRILKALLLATTALRFELEEVFTNEAPAPVGPFSQAIQAGPTLYLSGNIGTDTTGKFAGNDTETQTRQALMNIKAILKKAGMTFKNVVKTSVFLADLNDFPAMNKVYSKFVKKPYPARSAYQVARLPLDARIEIEVIAVKAKND